MPFQALQCGQSHRFSGGMWLGFCDAIPAPSPQLQHASSAASFKTPQAVQVQLADATPAKRV